MTTETAVQKVSADVFEHILFAEKNRSGAPITVRSRQTGKDYTFKISRSEYRGMWYTHVKVETGYLEFTYLGYYAKGKIWKKRDPVTSPSAVAIAFILKKVEAGEIGWLDQMMDVMHTGSCLSCGATLTDADSIERGLGPVCAGVR